VIAADMGARETNPPNSVGSLLTIAVLVVGSAGGSWDHVFKHLPK
jgi:hypothetical protein